MYERLGETVLKTGERMEIGVIMAPDAEWRDRIVPFLGHKSEPYASHIRLSNAGPLDDLETRYYIGHLRGEVISEVMIVGARGAGVLGHVFTRPEHRRKGAYQALMAAQMADMPRHGFQALSLGTGFDSAPYWIYHGFGFRGVGPGRGEMTWTAGEDAEAGLFRPGRTQARDAGWGDWGLFAWLGLLPPAPEEELPRSRVLRLRGRGLLEGPYVQLMLSREQTPGLTVRVLQSEHGAIVAWAILSPATLPDVRGGLHRTADPYWPSDAGTLDLHTHPAFAGELSSLLRDMPWPEAPVASLLTQPAGPKADALGAAGFQQAARLPGWLRADDGSRRDMAVWVRG
jgi:hypothetical protein